MTSPLIGITAGHSENKYGLPQIHLMRTYVDATIKAGGVPVIIPSELPEKGWRLLYEKLDGIIFSGGADIDPKIYKGEPHPTVHGLDHERDELEIALMRHSVEEKKPFLAICRGLQVLNIALGGTLYTHVSDQFNDQIQHATPREIDRSTPVHKIKIEEGCHLAKIVGLPILKVNSWHHQGVKDIPPQLKITARASDGLVEAMELPDHPFSIAVQWHPEWMPEDESMQKIFIALIEASKK